MKKLFLVFLLKGLLMGIILDKINVKGIDIPIIYEKTDLDIFSMKLEFISGGYRFEDKLSTAKLLSSILNEGTNKDGAIEFNNKLEDKGIDIYIKSGFTIRSVDVSSLIEYIDDSILFTKELLNDPNYKSLDRVKKILIGKIKQDEDDFDNVARDNLYKILFKNTPLQTNGIGKEEDIKKVDADDLKEFLKKTQVLSNLVIVVGGNIELDTFKQKIKPLLDTFEIGEKVEINMINVNKNKDEIIEKKDTEQAYIYFGSFFDIKKEDLPKAKLFSFILGSSGFGSRLMEEIRVKQGLAYSVYSYISTNDKIPYLMGYLQTKLENKEKAKKLVEKVIKEFIEKGATKEELEIAKKYLLGVEPLKNETISKRLSRAFNNYILGLDLNYSDKELKIIQNMTLEELNNYIKQHKEVLNLNFSIIEK